MSGSGQDTDDTAVMEMGTVLTLRKAATQEGKETSTKKF